jgi:RNA polymerase sigma-70 factor (ECF subfamily)
MSSDDASDASLLTAYRTGDDAALEKLLERYAPAVQRFGLKMCRDPEDAKDVLQDTLFAAARGMRDFRGASSLSTWLYTIARSFCIKRRRAEPDSVDLDAPGAPVELRDAEAPPDDAAHAREIGAALEDAIRRLTPEYREVLLLRDVEGLTAAEVAEVLGVGVDAVKSRLHRARVAVRARLAPMLIEREDAPTPTCPDVVPMLSRYLEGEIGAAECAEMDAHVSACPRCRAECDSLRRVLALCRTSAKEGAVPEHIQRIVREAIRGRGCV